MDPIWRERYTALGDVEVFGFVTGRSLAVMNIYSSSTNECPMGSQSPEAP